MESAYDDAKKFLAELKGEACILLKGAIADMRAYGPWNAAIFAVFLIIFSLPVRIAFVCVPGDAGSQLAHTVWQLFRLVPGVILPAAGATFFVHMVVATLYEKIEHREDLVVIEFALAALFLALCHGTAVVM